MGLEEEEQEEERAPSASVDVGQAVPQFILTSVYSWGLLGRGALGGWVGMAVPLGGYCFLGWGAHGSLIWGAHIS